MQIFDPLHHQQLYLWSQVYNDQTSAIKRCPRHACSHFIYLCCVRLSLGTSFILSINLPFFSGIPCGVSVHPHGQFSPSRIVDIGEIDRLRKDMATVAALLRLAGRLRDLFWAGQFAPHYARRWCDLYHRVLENCTAREWWGELFDCALSVGNIQAWWWIYLNVNRVSFSCT